MAIIAVDFDGTLSWGNYPMCGKPNYRLINWLNDMQAKGNKLILFTCREGKPLEDAIEWCRNLGLVFDAVNENLPEAIEEYGTNPRKIGYDILIDDKHFTSDFLVAKTKIDLQEKKKNVASILR